MMIKPESCEIGITDQLLEINNREDYYHTVLAMVRQSRRHILIFSHDLEHKIFASEDMYQAFKNLAIASPYSYVQILVQDIEPMTKMGHRLLELSRRVSSSVAIRVTSTEHQKILENFILVDDQALIIREHPERYEAIANFHSPLKCKSLTEKFVFMWEHGVADISLRKLSL